MFRVLPAEGAAGVQIEDGWLVVAGGFTLAFVTVAAEVVSDERLERLPRSGAYESRSLFTVLIVAHWSSDSASRERAFSISVVHVSASGTLSGSVALANRSSRSTIFRKIVSGSFIVVAGPRTFPRLVRDFRRLRNRIHHRYPFLPGD